MARFDGKTVLVTGGGGGIGRATCQRLASEGAMVIVTDRDLGAAEATVALITEAGHQARAIKCDITDRAEVDACVAAAGQIDVLVNNAGWDLFKPFLKTEAEDWKRLIDINLVGALNMLHAVLPQMVERHQGRVVTVASDAGRVGSLGEAVYSACKGGLISITKTLAREHARDGITLNAVCPGPTDTALLDGFKEGASNPDKLMAAFTRAIPLGRIAQPEDLPGTIAFFASDDAAYVTGQVLSVSGGLTMSG
ncbi:MAG: glucose 1-dehydrogenase [Pseudomonadota bacterium]